MVVVVVVLSEALIDRNPAVPIVFPDSFSTTSRKNDCFWNCARCNSLRVCMSSSFIGHSMGSHGNMVASSLKRFKMSWSLVADGRQNHNLWEEKTTPSGELGMLRVVSRVEVIICVFLAIPYQASFYSNFPKLPEKSALSILVLIIDT